MNNNGKTRNIYLDVIRGIACIFIIFIHRLFPGTAGDIIAAIARSGVAVFFIISGYYAYNKDAAVVYKRLPRKIKHAGKILGYSLIFYFIWETFVRWAGSGASSVYEWFANELLNPITWYHALIWDKDPLAGHLWFLFALVRCYILLAIVLKLKLEKKAPVISVLCLAMTLVMQKIHLDMMYFRNGWFYGMGFFMAGYAIAAARTEDFDKRRIYLGMIIGLVLSTIGGVVFPGEQIYFGTVILGISSFCWAVTKAGDTPKWPAAKMLAEIGAKFGTFIYVIHWAFRECLIKVDKMFSFAQQTWYLWIAPVLLAVISILASIVLYKIIDSVSKFSGGKQ